MWCGVSHHPLWMYCSVMQSLTPPLMHVKFHTILRWGKVIRNSDNCFPTSFNQRNNPSINCHPFYKCVTHRAHTCIYQAHLRLIMIFQFGRVSAQIMCLCAVCTMWLQLFIASKEALHLSWIIQNSTIQYNAIQYTLDYTTLLYTKYSTRQDKTTQHVQYNWNKRQS